MRALRFLITPAKLACVIAGLSTFLVMYYAGQSDLRHYDLTWGKTQQAAIVEPAISNQVTSEWKLRGGKREAVSFILYRASYHGGIVLLPFPDFKQHGQKVNFWVDSAGDISTTRVDRTSGPASLGNDITAAIVAALIATFIVAITRASRWAWWGNLFFSGQWYPI